MCIPLRESTYMWVSVHVVTVHVGYMWVGMHAWELPFSSTARATQQPSWLAAYPGQLSLVKAVI
jgi:hypothetical protein